VAQRTGAERFLALPAKSTSAGVALALVLAAFLLSGCGGGSSDSEGTAAAESQAAVSEDPSSNAAVSPQGAGAGAGSKADPTSSAGAAGNASGSDHSGSNAADGGQGQKHGPRIATPKGPTEQAPTPKQVASATVADMSLQSPAILAANGSPGQLAATYTCDGNDSWPKLRWSGVPDGTAELILYAMSVQPVEEQLFVDWAVAGLDPSLEGIEAGQLPKGAIVGTNGFGKRGYDICPSGTGEIYMFAIYALPQSLAPAKGFDARELRRQILAVSGNVGLLPAVYARG
jgi:phosphatidylethanolamine-binding protein (PEBP) family uncharacterized protein